MPRKVHPILYTCLVIALINLANGLGMLDSVSENARIVLLGGLLIMVCTMLWSLLKQRTRRRS